MALRRYSVLANDDPTQCPIMRPRQRTDMNMADGEINHPSDHPGHHRVSAKAADLIREWHEAPNRATEAEAGSGQSDVP